MTLSIGGFSRVVTFPTAPIATGRSDPCRKGLAPFQEPCLSTAHAYTALSPGTGIVCPRRSRASKARELGTSVGVPGPHGFAVREGHARLAQPTRPPHPASTFVTTRTPL
jgi:hypothetical protein